MGTTIKELSKELKLGRTSIEMRMNKIPHFRKNHVTKKHNIVYIDAPGVKLIKDLRHNKERQNSVKKSDTDTVNVNRLTVKHLKELLKQEQQHNSQLVNQLNHIDGSNEHLGKLLDQQQKLSLTDKAEKKELQGKIKHLRRISNRTNTSNGKSRKDVTTNKNMQIKSTRNNKPVQKRNLSFWQKIIAKLYSKYIESK